MKKVLLSIFATVALVTSCNEELLDTKNPNQFTDQSFYSTLGQVGTSVTAIYAEMQGNRLVGREYFFIHDLRSDDMAAGGGQLEVPRAQLLTGSHTYSNPVMSDVYKGLFTLVHRANVVITKGAELKNPSDPALLDRYIAEARFFRGFAYYTLGALWGGVPIYDTYGKSFNDAKPRSTQAEVFDFALADANAAGAVLPATYAAADNGRITKGAAFTLAGKINLCKGDYSAAKTALEAVKNTGVYALTDKFYDNFTEEAEYNKESVFEVGFLNNGYGWDADGNGTGAESWVRSQEYSAVGWRNLIPSDKLLAAFEANDPRLKDSFWFIGDKFANGTVTLTDGMVQGNTSMFNGSAQKISWKKYSVMYKLDPGGFNVNIGINYRLWRYADVLLSLAECENELGSSANAIAYLNQIRNRPSVSMPNYGSVAMNAIYPVTNQAEIRKAIQHERQVELCGEEIRNIDILRWRKNGKLTGPDPISYFQANKYEFLPIPQNEFNTNPKITATDQNPGY